MIRVERLLSASFALIASAAQAQQSATDTSAAPTPMSILAPRLDASPYVDAFYSSRNGALIWTKDEIRRPAIASFATLLRNSLI